MANFHFFDAGTADLSVVALFGEAETPVAHNIFMANDSEISFEYDDVLAGEIEQYEHGKTAVDRMYAGSTCKLTFKMREVKLVLTPFTDKTLEAIAEMSGKATVSAVAEETAYTQQNPAGVSGLARKLAWTLTPRDEGAASDVANKTIIIPRGVPRIIGSPMQFMADTVANRGIEVEVEGLLMSELLTIGTVESTYNYLWKTGVNAA